MTAEKKKTALLPLLLTLLCLSAVGIHYALSPWGFYWKVSPGEQALRLETAAAAEAWLGAKEADGSHRAIIDLYNRHEPLAEGYAVTYEDSWCAAFVSAAAIRQELTGIIPTECSCGRQIALLQAMGRWQERDDYIPLPGDLIYYDWDWEGSGDCTGWPDHVGLVVGTKWPFLKVIEGNKDDAVGCRYLLLNDRHIRGFGLPDYGSLASGS